MNYPVDVFNMMYYIEIVVLQLIRMINHGYEPQSKLWGIVPLLIRDNSANKLLFASLLKFESHYPPLRGIVQLTNSDL